MGHIEFSKPVIVVIALQFTYAALYITTRASLLEGMNPRVFVFYRQAVATLVIAPVAYFTRSETTRCHIGWKSFWLIFLAALVGVTINQMVLSEGLYLATSSAGSAILTLVPAITFVAASIVGYEPVNIRSLRTMAKILGTLVCVTSAAAMALIKGPKLLNTYLPSSNSLLLNSTTIDNIWLLGCLCLVACSCCTSFWQIFQVQVTKSYPDLLSLSAWMCFIATVQSSAVLLLTDPNLDAWKITSYLQLGSIVYAGIVGSAITIFAQTWIIQKRGPVFLAMFNPSNTVIVVIFASIFLKEQIYLGRVTINQMVLSEGLYLATSSAGSAILTLVPAITFVAASIVGYEPVNIRSLRTMAKILGTLVCVTSAAAMALIKGPKLLNTYLPSSNSLLLNSTTIDNIWLLGCLCLVACSCCTSFWQIFQVQVTKSYPDLLSLSAWMCFIATVQSSAVLLLTDPNLDAWKITSYLQLGSIVYAGIVGSAITIFAQTWIIQKRGPVFLAMFNPSNTVIVVIFASIFLKEQIYLGRVTINQMVLFEGLYLATSSAGSAILTLVPAITFVAASIVGYEPVNIRSLRTMAKILGTLVCVTSAAAMALIKGPKLLNTYLPSSNSLLLNSTTIDNIWLLGCLCLVACSCCTSFWQIFQVQVTKSYPDLLSLSAWMCFIATVQSSAVLLLTDPNLDAWKITSYLQLGSIVYAGIVGSAITIFAQTWIIQKRGPVFLAMFNPSNTVIVVIFASIFLKEQIYLGSAVAAVGIVIGLYVVLWGRLKMLKN